ncbi:MAG: aldehyde dehydrogenase family protein, partial [Rhodothermaceae bacterium]|nr:aldehyde dehydrogenase family protein [Rhodothermaceae bacterium]
MNTHPLLDSLGIAGPGAGLAIGTSTQLGGASPIDVNSPIDGSLIQRVGTATSAEVEAGCQAAHEAFLLWRTVPGPRRGELVRQFGQLLRENKEELGALVTLEAGKIQS